MNRVLCEACLIVMDVEHVGHPRKPCPACGCISRIHVIAPETAHLKLTGFAPEVRANRKEVARLPDLGFLLSSATRDRVFQPLLEDMTQDYLIVCRSCDPSSRRWLKLRFGVQAVIAVVGCMWVGAAGFVAKLLAPRQD